MELSVVSSDETQKFIFATEQEQSKPVSDLEKVTFGKDVFDNVQRVEPNPFLETPSTE